MYDYCIDHYKWIADIRYLINEPEPKIDIKIIVSLSDVIRVLVKSPQQPSTYG